MKYPTCSKCDHVLNHALEDDCETYYMVNGEIYCKCCFGDWAKEWLDENMDELAALIGVPVVRVHEE